jgi:hypothetical protein
MTPSDLDKLAAISVNVLEEYLGIAASFIVDDVLIAYQAKTTRPDHIAHTSFMPWLYYGLLKQALPDHLPFVQIQADIHSAYSL